MRHSHSTQVHQGEELSSSASCPEIASGRNAPEPTFFHVGICSITFLSFPESMGPPKLALFFFLSKFLILTNIIFSEKVRRASELPSFFIRQLSSLSFTEEDLAQSETEIQCYI